MKKLVLSVLFLSASTSAFAIDNSITDEACKSLLTEMSTLVEKAKSFTADQQILANLDRAMAQAENQIKLTPAEKQADECKKATEQLGMLRDAVGQLEQAATTQQ